MNRDLNKALEISAKEQESSGKRLKDYSIRMKTGTEEEDKAIIKGLKGKPRDIAKMLAWIFPGNWDMAKDPIAKNYTATIRFPEVEISNSKGLTHLIRELFVFLIVEPNGRLSGSMTGGRALLSWMEYNSGYRHSHLPGAGRVQPIRRDGGWNLQRNNFCTGSTDLTHAIADARVEYDPDKFEMLLYQIADYVQWESLAGGPHYRLESLFSGNRRLSSIGIDEKKENYQKFIKKFGTKGFPVSMEYAHGFSRFSVNRNDEDFQDMVTEIATQKVEKVGASGVFIGASDKETIMKEVNAYNSNYDKNFLCVFRGRKVYVRVEVKKSDWADTAVHAHPSIIKHIASKLSTGMTMFFINKQQERKLYGQRPKTK